MTESVKINLSLILQWLFILLQLCLHHFRLCAYAYRMFISGSNNIWILWFRIYYNVEKMSPCFVFNFSFSWSHYWWNKWLIMKTNAMPSLSSRLVMSLSKDIYIRTSVAIAIQRSILSERHGYEQSPMACIAIQVHVSTTNSDSWLTTIRVLWLNYFAIKGLPLDRIRRTVNRNAHSSTCSFNATYTLIHTESDLYTRAHLFWIQAHTASVLGNLYQKL